MNWYLLLDQEMVVRHKNIFYFYLKKSTTLMQIEITTKYAINIL